MPRSHRIQLAALLLAGLCLAPAQAQQIIVSPAADVLEGTVLSLRLRELPADTVVRVVSSRLATGIRPQQAHQAEASFKTDASGELDLGRQAPLTGSYDGADVRGLFWSMTAAAPAAQLPPLDAQQPGEIWLQVFAGDKLLAEKRLLLRRAASEVQTRPVAGFPGALFAHLPGLAKRPAIIVLGGSEGGAIAARNSGPRLASQGYAVLGLPYYSPPQWGAKGQEAAELPELPSSFVDIELSRLQQAHDWLIQQAEVDPARIAIYGVSKGAEFALAAAARMDWMRAVVAVAPSDVIWEGWGLAAPEPDKRSSFAWRGQALPWLPYKEFGEEMQGFSTGAPVYIRRPMDKGRAAHPERVAAARIAVENFSGALLLVAGTDDQMWDAAGMAGNITASRAAKGLATVNLTYPGAGHAISGTGWAPTTGYNLGPMKMGGSPAIDAAAQADAWLKTLAFFKQAL